MTPEKRNPRTRLNQVNPWRGQGVDRNGRRYSYRKSKTPGNWFRGWMVLIAVVVVVGSIITAVFG